MPTPSPRWPEIKALFDATADVTAARREPMIAAAGLDAGALAELRSLLTHHDAALSGGGFLAEAASVSLARAAPLAPAGPGAAQRGQRLGAWEIVRAVGTGGMGEVFEARRADGQYDGRAAVKLLKRGMDSAAVLQRFAQERQALARLAHPNIARLLDAGASSDGLPYFVMEFIDGRPIDDAARDLPLNARLALFLQLADAVAHAHRNLLVHRDLKPGNVLVDAEQRVKLLDFGIAKALDPLEGLGEAMASDTTLGGVRPYTPNHASPEQIRGEPVSTSTDIYSLGVLLYQLLTGVRPTGRTATTPAEAARSVLEETPTRPSALSPADITASRPGLAGNPHWLADRKRLRGDLDKVLMKALEKQPERRYASVDAMGADIRHHLAGRPVSARAASPAYVAGKFIQRHRWAVLAGVLGSVGLATGLAAALLLERVAAAVGAVGLAGGLGLALVQGGQAAVARDDARRQLAHIKQLTTGLVFHFGDALTRLPGGMKAQEAMLQKTLASLDTALAAAPHDADLTALVASALGRIAELQGSARQASPQRAAEAAATVQRALALGERAWPSHRADWRFAIWHIRTLTVQAQLLRGHGEPAAGLAALQRATQRCGELLGLPMSAEGRAHVMAERGAAHLFAAQLNAHATLPCLQRPSEALARYRDAEADYRALLADTALLLELDRDLTPGDVRAADAFHHQLAVALNGQASIHGLLGAVPEMRRLAETAFELRLATLEREPNNLAWRDGLITDAQTLAEARLRSSDAAGALAASDLAWRTQAELAAQEGPQSKWAGLRPVMTPLRAEVLAAAGRNAEAHGLLATAEGRPAAPG